MPPPARPADSDLQVVKQRLLSCGIGDRFALLTLSDFGPLGERWLKQLSPSNMAVAKPILRQGFVMYVNGKGAREFAHTLAGGIAVVFSAQVECLHLSVLSDALDNREVERIAELQASSLLVVSEFLNTSSNPLSARSAFRVEAFLLERIETHGKSLILLGDGIVSQTKWWTPRLVTRIQDTFIQETVANYAYPSSAQVFKSK